jgi:hypothetical protein
VVRLRLHREADVSSVGDLLVYSLDELEAAAERNGGVRRLLEEKWARAYKAASPRGLLTSDGMRDAAPPTPIRTLVRPLAPGRHGLC